MARYGLSEMSISLVPKLPFLLVRTLPKGNYAVIRHLGSYDHIKDSVYHLYRDSGYHNQRLK